VLTRLERPRAALRTRVELSRHDVHDGRLRTTKRVRASSSTTVCRSNCGGRSAVAVRATRGLRQQEERRQRDRGDLEPVLERLDEVIPFMPPSAMLA
jgi:hypothetical protein